MATVDTRTAREVLGLSRPGQPLPGEQQAPRPASPLQKAIDASVVAQRQVDDLLEEKRALESKRDVFGLAIVREGKLTRVQRTELSSVQRQLHKLETQLTRVRRARDKVGATRDRLAAQAQARQQREREKAQAKAEAATEKKKAANQLKLDKKIAAAEAKSLKAAGGFVQLPEGARPSKGTDKRVDRPVLQCGHLTKEGRGKTARWVLVVTDSYGLAVLPVQITGAPPKGDTIIPAEALKAIDKTRAFRFTKGGGIQPCTVETHQNVRMTEPPQDTSTGYTHDPARAEGWARTHTVKDVGTGYLVPDGMGRFPNHAQLVPDAPAKTNSFEWAFNPTLLKQFAEALGAGSGDAGNVVVTFNLAKAGKATEGRRVAGPVFLERHDPNTKRPVEGGGRAIVMPVTLHSR